MSKPTDRITAKDILNNADQINPERWWEAWMKDHHEYVKIRLDMESQQYVVDVAGQPRSSSEALWRYNDGNWAFRAAR